MVNTELNINTLASLIPEDATLQALKDLIDEFGLELESVSSL